MGALDFLSPINVATSAFKSIVDAWGNMQDRKDSENASIGADLVDLMEELRKTHSTIVKLVSPLRRITDNPASFSNEFVPVYNDFRDFYDAYDFGEARMHCHKVTQIQNRMKKRKPIFGTNAQWDQLFLSLDALGNADFSIIDNQYKPFMHYFDDTVNLINQHVQKNENAQAIAVKNNFLASIAPEYDKNKIILEQMTDLVGKLTAAL